VTRPITDRAKESLFERLGPRLEGARVADVFAGTGTMGLEALSRGAHSVVFIESDRQAVELLRRNVALLKVEDRTLCWQTDVLRTSFRPKGVDDFLPFDLIFFDPPYAMAADLEEGTPLYRAVQRLAREDVSHPEAVLILRTPARSEFKMPDAWERDGTLEQSSMVIERYRKRADEARDSG
jgi:16S rRNA (guanine966-N2)-methyltransferase